MKQFVNQIILLINTADPRFIVSVYTRIAADTPQKSWFVLHIGIFLKSFIKICLIENFNLESDRSVRDDPHLLSPLVAMGLGNILNILIT